MKRNAWDNQMDYLVIQNQTFTSTNSFSVKSAEGNTNVHCRFRLSKKNLSKTCKVVIPHMFPLQKSETQVSMLKLSGETNDPSRMMSLMNI